MQPTPLTGTATIHLVPHGGRDPPDAAHTPHGDGNFISLIRERIVVLEDAAHTPHGDGN